MRLLQIWRRENRKNVPADFARSIANDGYSGVEARKAGLLFMEGLSYLIREGLLIRDPEQSADFYVLSRTGRNVSDEKDFETGVPRSIDAREVLHPLIAAVALPELERGRAYFADAIFKAFRQVEIIVRKQSCLTGYGVPLMREAFRVGGPLHVPTVDPSEADALAHLFAGAIGRFKNPASHREVEESDIRVAFQLLAFASYLISQLELASLTQDDAPRI